MHVSVLYNITGRWVLVYNSWCKLQVRCNCRGVLQEVFSLDVLTCVCVCPLHFTDLLFEGGVVFETKLGGSCSVTCRVRSTTLLKYPPQVEWYRDRLFKQWNESLSEYVSVRSPYWQSRQDYPSATCVQQTGNVPRYNCDLNFQYCHREYMGRYRCDVTEIDTGKTVSRILRLRGTYILCNLF